MVDISSNYITDFVCTYQHSIDDEMSNVLYQIQLLQAFGLDDFNEEKINNITEKVYNKYKNNIYINKIINSNITKMNTIFPDKVTQFRTYFGFDTFHLLHNLLCSLINNTKISDENYNTLMNIKL